MIPVIYTGVSIIGVILTYQLFNPNEKANQILSLRFCLYNYGDKHFHFSYKFYYYARFSKTVYAIYRENEKDAYLH